MQPKLKYTLLIVAVVLMAAFPLAWQYQTGSIEGIVTTRQGPVAGTSIEVRNIMTGAVLLVRTDAKGHYEAAGLRPGRYSLWVETPEHDTVWIQRVMVERGRVTHRDVVLGPPIS